MDFSFVAGALSGRRPLIKGYIRRELLRAAVRSKKERLSGVHNEVCVGCGCDLAAGKEDDHVIGGKRSRGSSRDCGGGGAIPEALLDVASLRHMASASDSTPRRG